MFPLKSNQQGHILIFAMVFVAILLTLSTALIGSTTMHNRAEAQTIASHQALRLAEAGLDKAIYELNQNPAFSGEVNVPLGNGTVTIAVNDIDSSNKRITATGQVSYQGGLVATKAVQATANIDLTTVSFMFGVQVGDGGITTNNNSKVNGNVFSNGNISGSGEITGDASVAAGSALTTDQSWTTSTVDFLFQNSSLRRTAAQSFVPSVTTTLNKVQVYLKKIGNPNNLPVRVVSDNNGIPSKTVLAQGTISASLITTVYGFINGTFTSNPILSGGKKYWLLLGDSDSSNHYYSWGMDAADGYPNNTGKYSADWNAGTPVWNSSGGDLNFKTIMGGVTTTLSGVTVGGTARAMELLGCTINGNAYSQGVNTCTVVGSSTTGTPAPAPQALPISEAQIAAWESSAESGGVISGYILDGGQSASLGPIKVAGNLDINNGSTLLLTGPVWVTGTISIDNTSLVRNSILLGQSSTVLIADDPSNQSINGIIVVNNGAIITGNGNPNNYPIVISTYSGVDDAIRLDNNTSGTIFYAPNGRIHVNNNASPIQLTAYSIDLNNNAEVNYTTGLQNISFTSGPGGSWVYKAGTYTITK